MNTSAYSGLKRRAIIALLGWVSLCVAAQQQQPNAQQIVIPDGTAVRLRFAQRVIGPMSPLMRRVGQAKEGQAVKLVADADVRVEGRVVIARGASAHATVTDATSSLSLRLEWVAAVSGERIPLRPRAQGKRESFKVFDRRTSAGAEVGPSRGLLDMRDIREIPTGARTSAFVDGDIALARAEVELAQVQFPLRGPNALITVFRPRGHVRSVPPLYCNDELLPLLGERQYVVLDMPAGKYVFRGPAKLRVELSAAASEEYFVRLLYNKTLGEWELKLVEAGEGEDAVAESQPAPKSSLAAPPK